MKKSDKILQEALNNLPTNVIHPSHVSLFQNIKFNPIDFYVDPGSTVIHLDASTTYGSVHKIIEEMSWTLNDGRITTVKEMTINQLQESIQKILSEPSHKKLWLDIFIEEFKKRDRNDLAAKYILIKGN